MKQRGLSLLAKKAFDKAAAGVGLAVCAPLLGAVAVAVAVDLGRPVLFVQKRPGKGGRLFDFVKFRTMRDASDDHGRPLSDAERLTPLGAFLRASSLDELPSLWCVLRGDLSLVGPRPLLERYLALYSEEQQRRHEVLPGITGWAQVNGRNAISWQEKFAYDVWYVDNWSLWLDAKILLRTAKAVIKSEGISAEGHATMPPFEGNAGEDLKGAA